jgi:hypothetical protein
VLAQNASGHALALQPQVPAGCLPLSQHSLFADGSQHVAWALLEQHAGALCAVGAPATSAWLAAAGPPGLVARTIADAAEAWTRWVSVMETSVSPAACSAAVNSSRVRAPAMQPV